MSDEEVKKSYADLTLVIVGGGFILLGGLFFIFLKYVPSSLANIVKPFNYFSVNYRLLGIIGAIVGVIIIILGVLLADDKRHKVPFGITIIVLALASIMTSAFGIVVGGVLALVGGMVVVSSSSAHIEEAKVPSLVSEAKEEVKPAPAPKPVDYSASTESSPLVKPKVGEELVPIIVEPHNADRLRVLERTLIDIEKCPDGGEWVPPYRRKDGKLVRGHCRKIKGYEDISKSSVNKEYKKLLKEQEAGPKVIGYEKKPSTESENQATK
ncbi:MAG: DUF6114 domain-containing protein [Thermoplasmatales archaeon]|nr:DUF6114 domain-containing protein [Thermoplasmatales archaeon]MCW6169840.1 DUF6114 domain-containing protein [Thermoplasmatales archaeon]